MCFINEERERTASEEKRFQLIKDDVEAAKLRISVKRLLYLKEISNNNDHLLLFLHANGHDLNSPFVEKFLNPTRKSFDRFIEEDST